MRRIRVVLAEMPPLLNDIVRSVLEAEPDVALEPQPVGAAELASADAIARADVLILAEQDERRVDYAPTLYAHPRLRLVSISDDHRGAVVYEHRPHRAPLGDLSPECLVRAVRATPTSEVRV
jgi:hypothetical protein